jgi:hypothetical protein
MLLEVDSKRFSSGELRSTGSRKTPLPNEVEGRTSTMFACRSLPESIDGVAKPSALAMGCKPTKLTFVTGLMLRAPKLLALEIFRDVNPPVFVLQDRVWEIPVGGGFSASFASP